LIFAKYLHITCNNIIFTALIYFKSNKYMKDSKGVNQEVGKMTLADYYDNLPRQTSPKSDFVREVAKRCDISEATVRWWLRGQFRPSRKEFYRVLSEMTGISEENLFA
jgi:transcriptional regulator with XRE-family HTH domain